MNWAHSILKLALNEVVIRRQRPVIVEETVALTVNSKWRYNIKKKLGLFPVLIKKQHNKLSFLVCQLDVEYHSLMY